MTATAGLRLSDAVARAAARLAQAGVEEAAADARILAASAFGLDRTTLLVDRARPVTEADEAALDALVARRAVGEPVARILGVREFWSLPFRLGPATLVPRPETETVVETALALVGGKADLRILDLGTGSGCILLALLSELPEATGLGIDVDPHAVELAADNARRVGLGGRARFRRDDWRQPGWTAGLGGPFDLVVSNPPYIASEVIPTLSPEVRAFDPVSALDGGADGLDAYRILSRDLTRLLAPSGLAVFEIGADQGESVPALMGDVDLADIAVHADLAGRPRAISCRVPAEKGFGILDRSD